MGEKYKNIHQELIDNCKIGSTKAQFEIYKLYYKAMYNTSLRLVNDSMEAEDIMQESFLKAFNKIHTYKEEVSFGAWLKRIVINSSLDALKKRKLDTDPLENHQIAIADEPSGEEVSDTAQKVAEIKQVINELPENYRVLITLHLIEGYDHEEISSITGMSNAAVRTGYSRARKKLQEMLNTKKTSIWMN
ncbi:MAG: sigma-70 family RNA polymerase sigma factor [Bacteroidales bacterium]|nr:sigma-70 family RNA polymerase sigma factor [Bacteroidales bacterium]